MGAIAPDHQGREDRAAARTGQRGALAPRAARSTSQAASQASEADEEENAVGLVDERGAEDRELAPAAGETRGLGEEEQGARSARQDQPLLGEPAAAARDSRAAAAASRAAEPAKPLASSMTLPRPQ